MKTLQQVVWFLLIVGLLCVAAFLILFSVRAINFNSAIQLMAGIHGNYRFGILGMLLFILGIWMIHPLLRRNGAHAVVEDAEMGEIRVTLAAVDSLVSEVIGKMDEVEDLKSRIRSGPSGVNVGLHLAVNSDSRVPELTERIQTRVTEVLKDSLGITVTGVEVLIRDIRPVQREEGE